jgi:hypothetical protein
VPGVKTAILPDFEGATRDDRRAPRRAHTQPALRLSYADPAAAKVKSLPDAAHQVDVPAALAFSDELFDS